MLERIHELKNKVIISRKITLLLTIFIVVNILLCGISILIFKMAFNQWQNKSLMIYFIILSISIFLITIVELVLIAYMSSKEIQSANQSENDNQPFTSEELFSEFIKKTEQLTPTERIIFNSYLEGKTGKEVTLQLGITLNTLKVHNNHIYKKLDVSSKEELSLYINLISKSGMISEIAK